MTSFSVNVKHMEDYDAFDRWMRLSGQTEETRRLRHFHLARMAREFAEAHDGADFKTATEDDLEDLLTRHEWKPNTRRAYRSSIRAYFRFLKRKHIIDVDVAEALPEVRVPRSQVRAATDDAYINAAKTATDERVRLAAQLGGVCGLRRAEVARVRYDDLIETTGGWSLRVVGKGGHERTVPVPATLALDIMYHQSTHGGWWLFPGRDPREHITPGHLAKLVSRAMGPNAHMHQLRHRAGTKAYEATRDIRAVQQFLGHAQITTTEIYTHVDDDKIRAAMLGAAS